MHPPQVKEYRMIGGAWDGGSRFLMAEPKKHEQLEVMRGERRYLYSFNAKCRAFVFCKEISSECAGGK